MKSNRRNTLEPRTYLADMSRPLWYLEESIYVNNHVTDSTLKSRRRNKNQLESVDEGYSTQKFLTAIFPPGGLMSDVLQTTKINCLSAKVGAEFQINGRQFLPVFFARELSPLLYLVQHANDPANVAANSAEAYFMGILKDVRFLPGEGWLVSEEAEDLVIETIRRLGTDAMCAFRLNEHLDYVMGENKLKQLSLVNRVTIFVSAVIRVWQHQVLFGRRKARLHATTRLKQVGRALIPETRGITKKNQRIFPVDVKLYYFECLFRLYHVRNALKTSSDTIREKVEAASRNFDLALDVIREFFGLDDIYEIARGSGPYPIKDMARVMTARHFGITQHTVANLISS